MSKCIECWSFNTELFEGDDGHFRKECLDCGYTGGPYVTSSILEREDDESRIEKDSQNEADGIFDY